MHNTLEVNEYLVKANPAASERPRDATHTSRSLKSSSYECPKNGCPICFRVCRDSCRNPALAPVRGTTRGQATRLPSGGARRARPHRRHTHDRAALAIAADRLPCAGQGGIPQPGWVVQGPRGRGDHPRGRGVGRAARGRHGGRGNRGEHRCPTYQPFL